jgi:uncharacterized surface protein with fasciclin (FAS1) repeats
MRARPPKNVEMFKMFETSSYGSNDANLQEFALQAGGLVDELSGPDKLTVFAPTDAAFEALLAAEELTAEELLGNLDLLRLILGYHVVKGEVLSSDLSNGQVIDTLIPATLSVLIDDMGVFIVPGGGEPAKVIGADVLASNGVVHIIDKVLIPPTPGAAPAAE